jgi:Protein of unknown function (DUF3892)
MALDVLLVRETATAVPTAITLPKTWPTSPTHKQIVPGPFGGGTARPAGAYLSWSLPDGLTRAVPAQSGTTPKFPAIPQRWLVLRLTGDVTAGPRTVTGWILPDVNADPPTSIANVLGQAAPPIPAPPVAPLTVLGTGDLSWSGYFDNVVNVLGLYDDLSGVTGAVSYLVCGWYLHAQLDPLSGATDANVADLIAEFGWSLPHGTAITGPARPTSILCHGAAVGLGWPTPSWHGDGGTLGQESGGPPDPATVDVALADTIAEAAAALGDSIGSTDPIDQLLVQATIGGMLSTLAQPDGPATLDTALHASRFKSLASTDTSETIWQPNTPSSNGSQSSSNSSNDSTPTGATAASTLLSSEGLADAVAASRRRAGLARAAAAPQDTDPGSDDGGQLVDAGRSTPRVFAPVDPVILLRGAGRSYSHGADGRYTTDGTLACRLSGETVTWAGAAGTAAPDPSTLIDPNVQAQLSTLGAPVDTWSLLLETLALDPSSAPDLASASATQPSPDAAARHAWLADPSQPPPALTGALPSPVGIGGPAQPWSPMHVEWQLDWEAASDGIHAFMLGSVDFDTPDSGSLPSTDQAVTIDGRSLLSAAPANIASGGATTALAHLDAAGMLDGHPFAERLRRAVAPLAAAGGRAAITGATGALADADLLSGSLESFLAQLRHETTDPVLGPTGTTSTVTTRPTAPDPIRAGLVRLTRARVVDSFGQTVDLAGSSATTAVDLTRVHVGAAEAVDGAPGVMVLVPRFNAPARVMLRYTDAGGNRHDATTAISPLCGFVVPSPLDGSLEFFDADGNALGRLRPDDRLGTVWEEDPGQRASLGRKPSTTIANKFLGALADDLLAADGAQAATAEPGSVGQTALAALNLLIDTTRWTVDATGSSGDEHLALLLGHPVAVLRAGIKIDIQYSAPNSTAPNIQVPVKLGTLAHTQDGLLAYFVADDYTRVHAVDPSIGDVIATGGTPITSPYVDLSPSFPVQPTTGIDLTLLAVPASEMHCTVGLLPQKDVGMRRDWVSAGLAKLAPNWRYGPVLVDRKATRIPVPSDVHGTWAWHRRPDPTSWTTDAVVNATGTAIIPDDRAAVQYGWISLQLLADPDFPGIPIQVSCITKPIRDAKHRIQGIGGLNHDGSRWWMTLDSAIAMVESKRFSFFVLDGTTKVSIVVDISASGRKFLRTDFDGKPTNNLEQLPECPSPPS